jgi:hypothetical protein
MTATMIKMDNGYFIPKFDAFDDIKKDVIKVNIDLDKEEYDKLSYKELKGIGIMERYYEKLENQIDTDNKISDIQKNFRKKYNLKMDLKHYLKVN